MPHVITEAATFDPSVTVPDGTDSRANAAEVVEGIAQVLANRSQYLKSRADGAAQRAQSNTFTQPNTFNATITAQGITAALDVNCRELIAQQSAVVGAGAGGGSLEVHGDVVVRPDNNYVYDTPLPTRAKQLALARGTGNFSTPNANIRQYGSADWLANWNGTADGWFWLPLEVPSGSQLLSVDIQYEGGGSDGAFQFAVVRKPISDWSADPSGTPSGGAIIGAAASSLSGWHTANLALGSYAVDNQAESYALRILFNDGFDGGNVQAVRLNFYDNGLNNY